MVIILLPLKTENSEDHDHMCSKSFGRGSWSSSFSLSIPTWMIREKPRMSCETHSGSRQRDANVQELCFGVRHLVIRWPFTGGHLSQCTSSERWIDSILWAATACQSPKDVFDFERGNRVSRQFLRLRNAF